MPSITDPGAATPDVRSTETPHRTLRLSFHPRWFALAFATTFIIDKYLIHLTP